MAGMRMAFLVPGKPPAVTLIEELFNVKRALPHLDWNRVCGG